MNLSPSTHVQQMYVCALGSLLNKDALLLWGLLALLRLVRPSVKPVPETIYTGKIELIILPLFRLKGTNIPPPCSRKDLCTKLVLLSM